jgi:hypothetical protein
MRGLGAALMTMTLTAVSPARAELPPWMLQGERLTMEMSWLGITGGTMVLEASRSADGSPLHLTMRATSSSFVSKIIEVDDRFETLIDPSTSTALLSTKNTREGSHTLDERVEFDAKAGTARRWKNGRERQPLQTPVPTLDTLGAIYFIRTLPLEVGRTFSFSVQSGDKVYPMQVKVLERRNAKTALGRLDVFVVEPSFADGGLFGGKGKSVIWVTAEAPCTVVRISSELPFGSLTASLTKVERPWRGVLESNRGSGGVAKQDGSQTR